MGEAMIGWASPFPLGTEGCLRGVSPILIVVTDRDGIIIAKIKGQLTDDAGTRDKSPGRNLWIGVKRCGVPQSPRRNTHNSTAEG
jgi:hypothetical protein